MCSRKVPAPASSGCFDLVVVRWIAGETADGFAAWVLAALR